jgi:phosphotransacetylase/acyl dehydratase
MPTFANKTFAEIEIGASVSVSRPLSLNEVEALALVSGDMDAFHLAEETPNLPDGVVAKAVGAEALISALIARQLPGPGSTIVAHEFRFEGQVGVGETLDVTVTAREKRPDGGLILFECRVRSGGQDLVAGTVLVRAPTERLTYTDIATPQLLLRRNDAFAKLLRAVQGLTPAVTAVVHPCDRDSLLGPIEAARRGLIVPLLVGSEAKIRAVAQAEGVDLSPYRIVPTEHSHAAAQQAVAMARSGEVEALMKGSLHTDELMAAVVPSATGIRTARRVSHVFVLDVPAYPRPLFVTDAAINIYPTLEDKADIVQNAIELAHVLGIEAPRVALLSAMETVNPKVQSTLDAAALCKMADRGQITGGVLDGPLAFDNAISEEAARTKKIVSPVAGRADILVVPDLEAGNMVAKQLQYFAGADSAGIVLGTRVPIVLTSRADSVRTRLASTAVMLLVADAKRRVAKAPGG